MHKAERTPANPRCRNQWYHFSSPTKATIDPTSYAAGTRSNTFLRHIRDSTPDIAKEMDFKMVGSYPESPPGEAHGHMSTKTGSDIPQQLPHRCPEGSGCQPKIVSGKHTAKALVKMMWEWPLQLPRDPTYPGTIRISETGEFRIVHGVSSGPSLEDMAKDRKVRVGTMYLLEALRTVLGYRLLWNRQQPWENCATESCDQQAWYIISRFNEVQRLGEESDPEIERNIFLKSGRGP
ncbi:hypothetical protein EDB80DRAFT_805993 [Ilyonectria destructans]|nr:hypothetical protein EDB80DRAFT_805993 [Ilyonectria destructans]